MNLELVDRLVLINQSKDKDFRVDESEVMRFLDQVCVLMYPN